ncbi:MAG: 2-succinyl-6-hydroxy-2,4-cyclohexadiene-1-carboxylate synthase [Thermomicrobiales bacterium]|nr:2-succinyl-6-hydroxy-2,4-cyclohexadiene-1-carboxylate synthase [Thermomicrobiales bacterium]
MYRVRSRGAGPPLLLLHGFTGSGAVWDALAPALARHHRLIMPDLLGHGGSSAPTDPARFAAERQIVDIMVVCRVLGVDRFHLLGYSMGARLALAVAANCPDRIARLVLESGSPGIAEPLGRCERTRSDAVLAEAIERDGVAAFVMRWGRLPLFAAQSRLPEATQERQRRLRLRNRPEGLAASLRGFGQGAQPPLHDALTRLPMPTLAVAGAEDAKYVRLGEEMAARLPRGRLVVMDGAGHTPHLEQPESFLAVMMSFLSESESAASGPGA